MLILNLFRFSILALITVEVFAKRVDPLKKIRILNRSGEDNPLLDEKSPLSEEKNPPPDEEDPRIGRPGYHPGRPHPGRPYPEHPYGERPYPERPYPERPYPEHPYHPEHPYPEHEPYPPWEPVTFPPTYPTQTRTTTNMTTPRPPGQCCCQCQCDCLDGVLINKIDIGRNQTTPNLPPQCPICFHPNRPQGKRGIEDEQELIWDENMEADPHIRAKRQTLFVDCFTAIRAAQFLDTGTLLGLLVGTLLANLVVPILLTILAGDNSLNNAVLPLANILCYIVGLLLLVLRSLGLLGLLGMGGLLQNILGG